MKNETIDGGERVQANVIKRVKGKEGELPVAGKGSKQDPKKAPRLSVPKWLRLLCKQHDLCSTGTTYSTQFTQRHAGRVSVNQWPAQSCSEVSDSEGHLKDVFVQLPEGGGSADSISVLSNSSWGFVTPFWGSYCLSPVLLSCTFKNATSRTQVKLAKAIPVHCPVLPDPLHTKFLQNTLHPSIGLVRKVRERS